MLATGAAAHIEVIHGETIVVLNGVDAGKRFTAVKEIEPDALVTSDSINDYRAKRILRFRLPVPNLRPTDQVQTDDGKKWTTTRRPDDSYLTVDFELTEVTAKDK
jgi:ribosomal protein L14E/L6E/L27E